MTVKCSLDAPSLSTSRFPTSLCTRSTRKFARLLIEITTRAESLLKEHEEKLHVMAKALMKYETIDMEQVKDIMAGREPRPPADWDDSDDSPSVKKKDDKSDTVTPIGGPASEH